MIGFCMSFIELGLVLYGNIVGKYKQDSERENVHHCKKKGPQPPPL